MFTVWPLFVLNEVIPGKLRTDQGHSELYKSESWRVNKLSKKAVIYYTSVIVLHSTFALPYIKMIHLWNIFQPLFHPPTVLSAPIIYLLTHSVLLFAIIPDSPFMNNVFATIILCDRPLFFLPRSSFCSWHSYGRLRRAVCGNKRRSDYAWHSGTIQRRHYRQQHLSQDAPRPCTA